MGTPTGAALALAMGLLVIGCGSDDKKPTGSGGSSSGGSGGSSSGGSSSGGSSSGGTGGIKWKAAVGEQGSFVQTFDDENWQTRTLTDHDLYSVTCVGNLDGWSVGADGLVVHSADGGDTWQPQASSVTTTLRSVHFALGASKLIGIAAGDAGTLIPSSDGGDTWQPVDSKTSSDLRGTAAGLGGQLLVAVGNAATLVVSHDAGGSWQTSALPGATDLTAVTSDANATRVLTVDIDGHVWASTDQAKSFQLEVTFPEALHAVSVGPNGQRALVAGNGGAAYSRDANGVWTPAATGTTKDLFAALITHDGSHSYLAGQAGALLSSDTDTSFQQVNIETTLNLFGLEDLDPH